MIRLYRDKTEVREDVSNILDDANPSMCEPPIVNQSYINQCEMIERVIDYQVQYRKTVYPYSKNLTPDERQNEYLMLDHYRNEVYDFLERKDVLDFALKMIVEKFHIQSLVKKELESESA
tara:strand:- start:324 stop:683 length:360 start_codon:yes stop_codon:yes gene_type:complete